MLLEGKNAVIYGGGSVGGAVARTFAREGARVFLAGRTRETLEAVAAGIDGAEVAVLDATDREAVDRRASEVVAQAGSLDISINLIWRGDLQGIPLLQMEAEDFLRPVTTGLMSNFHTARAAARHMVEQGSGVIMTLTSGSAQAVSPGMGGTPPADAATETFLRYLASEVGPQGVRVVGMYTAAVPETLTREKLARAGADVDPSVVVEAVGGMAMLGRPARLDDLAETTAFLASDRAGSITGTIVNVTAGLLAR